LCIQFSFFGSLSRKYIGMFFRVASKAHFVAKTTRPSVDGFTTAYMPHLRVMRRHKILWKIQV
jgi:hypothetical protein